jgi:hypothetical protein
MKPVSSFFSFARILALGTLLVLGTHAQAQSDPLPTSNDGSSKQAIVGFVKATTTQGSPQFVPPAERIATFDQDGTLWVEHPMYSQVMYCLDRVPAGGGGSRAGAVGPIAGIDLHHQHADLSAQGNECLFKAGNRRPDCQRQDHQAWAWLTWSRPFCLD